jgi:hypothetical protein
MACDQTSSEPAQSGNHGPDLEALPSDWRLVRVGRDKRPIGGENWFDADDYSPDDALALNGSGPPAWGLKSGPASGVIVLDLDAEGWRDSFLEVTGHPITDLPPTIAWTSGKPGRSGHAFSVADLEWWPHLANRRSWSNAAGDTCWELRGDRHQAVIIGAHPDTTGYHWFPGRSPQEIPDPAAAPDWLLEVLLVQELPDAEPVEPTARDAARALAMLQALPPDAFSAYSDWLRIGMALHHTDPALLSAWVDWCRPMPNFDEAECLAKWQSFGKGHRGRPATIATLHHLARQHGYHEPRNDLHSAAIAAEAEQLQAKLAHRQVGQAITLAHLFPAPIAEALELRTRYLPADPCAVAALFLPSIASLQKIGCTITGNPASGFTVPLNLWAAVVAKSGQKKTPLQKRLVLEPVAEVIRALADGNRRERQQWQDDQKGKKRGEQTTHRNLSTCMSAT